MRELVSQKSSESKITRADNSTKIGEDFSSNSRLELQIINK